MSGDENSTDLVLRSFNNTERVFKNDVTDKVKELEAEFPGDITKIMHALCSLYQTARSVLNVSFIWENRMKKAGDEC